MPREAQTRSAVNELRSAIPWGGGDLSTHVAIVFMGTAPLPVNSKESFAGGEGRYLECGVRHRHAAP